METNRKTRRAVGLSARRIDRRPGIGSLVLLLGLLTVMGQAQISPSDDAYVNSAAPTTNYGAATTLNLQSAADTAFIRFDLTAVPAGYTGSSIAKATLKLYVNSATTAGSFNVDYVIGTWAEKTITYSLQPAIGTTIAASVPLTIASKGKYVEIDVTAAVVEWLNGTQANDGIALVANSPLVATFDSKENTSASHPPELDLVFASIAGITTASGSGLTGGGTSGTLNLSLLTSCAANQVLQWNGTAWACSSSGTGTITGVFAGTDLTGGGTNNNVTLNLDVNKTDVRYPQLQAANTFTGNQSVTGNVAVSGTVFGGTGSFGSVAVSSNAQVANLNASLLDGLSAGSFAPAGSYATTTGANTFTKNQTIAGGSNGQTAIIGDMGCGLGGAGIGFFGNPSGCTNYGLLGFGSDTLINRPSGGTIRFRENNGADTGFSDQMVITSGGYVGIGTFSPSATLEVDSPSSDAGRFVGGPSTSDSRNNGIIAYGGVDNDNTFATHGGPGGLFWGGDSNNPYGVSGDGINASPGNAYALGYAGYFNGDVNVTGHFYAGVKNFKIDHPLDPANKYLYHSSVESSEVMNIYTGNITTDSQGDATIQLPEWFETLNGDFRYQLTVIGRFAQAIVASEIENNQFRIKTDQPSVKVSWQVTGVRQDAYAKAHPLQVEVGKSEHERGFYIHPELYGAPEEKGMEWARHPEMMKQMRERQQKMSEGWAKTNQRSK